MVIYLLVFKEKGFQIKVKNIIQNPRLFYQKTSFLKKQNVLRGNLY